jgi:3-deoxy-D-manno-octulosonate 8-phosphate phosphatase (KDO 8-P phosphatase)
MIEKALADKLKLFVLDVDGVLTDGFLFIGESGEEFKGFNVKDGVAVQLLRLHGIETAVLSGKASKPLEFRCKQLGIEHAVFGCKNKHEGLHKLRDKTDIAFGEMLICGDDVIDLPAMKLAGAAACPSDAHRLVKEAGVMVLSAKGGSGVVRELADLVLEVRCGSLTRAYEKLMSDFVSKNVNRTEQ